MLNLLIYRFIISLIGIGASTAYFFPVIAIMYS